ncbi:MAG: lipase maturation factor family protein [Chloroflexi bacterium]|nr:MAG: lipase maturation factor family protein [Chloroflexota bacterium]
MDWFSAPDYWLTRFVFQRALALVYLVAFLVAVNQFRPLLGERGLLPVPEFLRAASFRRAPSLFHLGYSNRLFAVVAWTGVALSAAAVLSLPERASLPVSMLVWFALWVLYLSIVNVGQTFYAFGWESLLLESGFLAIFLGSSDTPPPVLVIWLLRWLLFRLEFGAGLIKMRGDRCWRNLTCLDYHHETQPMPNPLSWYFHRLPKRLHRIETAGNHVAQLVAPFGLFAPQPGAEIAATFMVITQLWLVLSGNFSWLNVLTITLAISAFDGSWLHHIIPASAPAMTGPPAWYEAVVVLLTVVVVVLSWWPVRNMVSSRQAMNLSFNRIHLVNTYGAFGSVTRVRNEIVIEGTGEEEVTPTTVWKEYGFKGKPGDPCRRPPQVAPYHLRLDWLMWFAALSPIYARSWFVPLMVRLLEDDSATLALLGHNPFSGRPPSLVRARLYRYQFTTWPQRRESGAWWTRELVGDYLRPIALRDVRE